MTSTYEKEPTIGVAFHDHIVSMLTTGGMRVCIDRDLTVKNICLFSCTEHLVNENWASTNWNIGTTAVSSVGVVQLLADDIRLLIGNASLAD